MDAIRTAAACFAAFGVSLVALAGSPQARSAGPGGTAAPAKIAVAVSPQQVGAGEGAHVTVRIEPAAGVKINRYPKIKLQVPEQAGLTPGGEATAGSDTPPPPDKLSSNYFEHLEPVELALTISAAATPGVHELEGKLTYFYCVPASGFCAPARVPVKIAVNVR